MWQVGWMEYVWVPEAPSIWYLGDEETVLCPDCAKAWSEDNMDASWEGEETGYVQTGGQLELIEPEPTDCCKVCKKGATK